MTEIFNILSPFVALSSLFAAIIVVILDKLRRKGKIEKVIDRGDINIHNMNFIEGSVSNRQTNFGVRNLILYAMRNDPDFVIGLNKGGALIGSMISLALGLHTKQFKKCGIYVENKNQVVECDVSNLHGTVLIVDSIVRTGNTMNNAIKYFTSNCKNVDELITASIVTNVNIEQQPIYNKLNYSIFKTTDACLPFPWSKSRKSQIVENRYDDIKKEFDESKDKKIELLAQEIYSKMHNDI